VEVRSVGEREVDLQLDVVAAVAHEGATQRRGCPVAADDPDRDRTDEAAVRHAHAAGANAGHHGAVGEVGGADDGVAVEARPEVAVGGDGLAGVDRVGVAAGGVVGVAS